MGYDASDEDGSVGPSDKGGVKYKVDERRFKMRKRAVLERLESARMDGTLDPDIHPVLESINNHDGLYTLSSCQGRVQVICLNEIGDKVGARVAGKWHHTPKIEELCALLDTTHEWKYVFLMVQPPLIHVSCADLDIALKLRQVANDSGFKYTNIRSISLRNVVVEIIGSDRLDLPLYFQGRALVNPASFDQILTITSDILERGTAKLRRLRENMERVTFSRT